VDTHPVAKTSLIRRCAAAGIAVLGAAALLTVAVSAGAQPQPTIGQVQAKLKALNYKQNWLTQQYDQATADLASARERLALVDREVNRDNVSVAAMRAQIAQIASNVYENGSMTSVAALLTSGDPQTLLGQSAYLTHLSSDNHQQLEAFITTNRQLAGARAMAKRTEASIAALKRSLAAKRAAIAKAIAQEKTLLASLTPAQAQAAVGGGGTTGGSTGGGTPAPASGQAAKAVAFARAQLGCTYYFGGTGPCHAPGFDCSGLTMSAWAYAGVSIPRTSYGQATLPYVPRSNIQPGDILEFAGDSHVGIAVGGGMLIDAPTAGIPVEEVSLSSSWYASNFDGAYRP
jgi:cell wall-associated NlpC family hydrolase